MAPDDSTSSDPAAKPAAAARGLSKLPVPRKLGSGLPVPTSRQSSIPKTPPATEARPKNTLRASASSQSLRSADVADPLKPVVQFGGVPDPTPLGRPYVSKRPSTQSLRSPVKEESGSRGGGYLAGTSASAAKNAPKVYGFNVATGSPLKKQPSVASLPASAHSTPPASPGRFAKRSSIADKPLTPKLAPTLAKQPSIPTFSRKPSLPQLQQTPRVAGAPRRTSDFNGVPVPLSPLGRPTIASGLPQTPMRKKSSVANFNSPERDPPTLLRKPSTELRAPAPRTPTLAKTPYKAPPKPASPRTPASPRSPPKVVASSPKVSSPKVSSPKASSSKVSSPKASSPKTPISPKVAVPRTTARASPKAQAVSLEKPKGQYREASQTLRETIMKARKESKAAANAEAEPSPPLTPGTAMGAFDFGDNPDPFGQAVLGVGGSNKVLQQRIKSARVEGRLSIAALDLKEIPESVYKMYESSEADLAAPADIDGPKWYESVDLVRMIAADNEIETISEQLVEQFSGLQQIDMHNNVLTSLPTNFGTLTELTVLNLSNNKLTNRVLEVICQITSLKDLKLARNNLEGMLPASISKLTNLESLELQENRLKSLPGSLSQLSKLHILHAASNALTFIPFGALCRSPLAELYVGSNKLSGALFPEIVKSMPSLKILDIRNNNLTCISEREETGEIDDFALPHLAQLLASNNTLSSIPPLGAWSDLVVLQLDNNHLTTLPDGLTELTKLRTLDITANDISALPPTLAAVESLEILRFAGNPLRDRNLLSASSTNDVLKTLRGRLHPPTPTIVVADMDGESPSEGLTLHSPEPDEFGLCVGDSSRKGLEVGKSGVLDLSCKDYTGLGEDVVARVIGSPSTLLLAKNQIPAVPTAIARWDRTISTLDLSQNRFADPAAYLTTPLSLRALTNLSLVGCGLTSLAPLVQHLDAPRLETLDVCHNRVTSIAGVKPAFAALQVLLADGCKVTAIPVADVRGLRTLDLSGNEVESLPPELGLCEGLRDLRVRGNRFKYPGHRVLESGTEKLLEWLRERIRDDDVD